MHKENKNNDLIQQFLLFHVGFCYTFTGVPQGIQTQNCWIKYLLNHKAGIHFNVIQFCSVPMLMPTRFVLAFSQRENKACVITV